MKTSDSNNRGRGKATKILITEMGSIKNKGNLAILHGTMKALSTYFANAQFTVLSHGPSTEIQSYSVRALPSIVEVPSADLPFLTRALKTIVDIHRLILAMVLASLWSSLKAFIGINATFLIRYSRLCEYANADIIIVRGTDTLTDQYGRFGLDSLVMRFSGILLGVIMRKPTIICGHSIGPFKSWIGRTMARFVLNRVSLIMPREEVSRANLRKIGVRNPNVFKTADLAFLLEPASRKHVREVLLKEGIRTRKPIVGISASRLVSSYAKSKSMEEAYAQYIEFMAKMADYIIDNFHAIIIFIPHVIGPGKKFDDRIVSQDIFDLVHNRKDVKLIWGDYSPQELRGIIGLCDMFIGARMHAVISALSMHVPSLALSYLHKTEGILEMLGQEKWICHIQNLDHEDTKLKVNALWTSRRQIQKDLESRIKVVRKRALLNPKLVKNLYALSYES